MGLRRGGQNQTVNVRAEAAPATPARDEQTIGGQSPFTGATVVNLSPATADELGLDPFAADDQVAFPVTVGDFIRFYENAAA